jgi:hypothetical protein
VLVVPSPQLLWPLQQDSVEEHGWPFPRHSTVPPMHVAPSGPAVQVPPAQQTVAASHASPVLMQYPGGPTASASASALASEPESEPPSSVVLSPPAPASDPTGLELDEQAMTQTASDAHRPAEGPWSTQPIVDVPGLVEGESGRPRLARYLGGAHYLADPTASHSLSAALTRSWGRPSRTISR